METGGPSAIEVVLWVLGANAFLILAAYGLVWWLRKQSLTVVQRAGVRIQDYDNRLGQIAGFLQEFIGINQEPYSTRLDELQKEASDLQERMQVFLQACHDFEEEIQQPVTNRLQEIINSPANWFRRWRRSRELAQESDAIAEMLAESETQVQQIYKLPWELALQCRQAEKEVYELIRLAQDLQAKGVRGQAMQAVLNLIPLLRRALDAIPPEFLKSDQDALLAVANLDTTIQVFESLNRIRPGLNRYLPQAKEWNTWHQKATTEFKDLKLAGVNLRQTIQAPSRGLVVTSLQDRLDQVALLAADLGQRIALPEAEELKMISRETSQLRKVLRDTEQNLDRARKQSGELYQRMNELDAGLESLEKQYTGLGQRDVFPLALDVSRQRMNDLRRRLQTVGPIEQPRTPEQVALHLTEVERIQAGLKVQTDSFPQAADQHLALVGALENVELRDGAAWLHKARETVGQVSTYDPRNWPKQDAIQTLPAELEELEKLHGSLVPADRSAPIKESELVQRLKDTRALVAQHKALRPRVESVIARLEKLRAMEKEGKESLTESFTALERIGLLAESNDLLNEIAAAELERLSDEIRVLGNELNSQNQGEVEKKLQKIQALSDKVNRSLNTWLARLNGAISDLSKQIRDRLIEVDAIAQIDDPLVVDARSVLSRNEVQSAPSTGGQGMSTAAGGLRGVAAKVVERGAALQRAPLLANLEATAEIKRKNDLWQTLAAALQALQEKTAALLVAHQEMVQARSETRESLTEIVKRNPERRAWPPNNQSPLNDAQALQPADEKWEALKKQPRKVDQAVFELGRLTQQYRLLTERARQMLGRVEQDEERVQELEEQIAELKQRWQAQAQANSDSPVIHEGVQQLMSQADSKLAYIKHQYMRSAISYEQVIHNLQLLCDELFSSRIAIDEQNDIGLNENHHSQTTQSLP